MTEKFKKIIDVDIEKCEEQIKNGNKDTRGKLYGLLVSKYGKIIDGFDMGLIDLFYDTEGIFLIGNLEKMKEKLLLFKAMDYKNSYSKDESREITVNNTNNLSATFNISFTDVKKQVEDMTSLKDEEIEEIHQKIDELEQIVNSSERKTKKWDMAKDIIKWIADKSVDVGIALLPLIFKIGQ